MAFGLSSKRSKPDFHGGQVIDSEYLLPRPREFCRPSGRRFSSSESARIAHSRQIPEYKAAYVPHAKKATLAAALLCRIRSAIVMVFTQFHLRATKCANRKTAFDWNRRSRAGALTGFSLTILFTLLLRPEVLPAGQAPDPCLQNFNPIVCENQKPGDPASDWDIAGAGDASVQGFTTEMSVDQGQTVLFKIDTAASAVQLDIYRMGYYGGFGARKVATIPSSQVTETNQQSCLTNASTGLIDCGNWSVSASWTVPTTATSGIYFAKATRTDTGGASHIFFVVRDDDGLSNIIFQTSDTTWQAYNQYGGNSLYVGNPVGRAYKVSYNRPLTTRGTTPEDFVFNAEYPMVRWLEQNGYDVSYISGVDSERSGSSILLPSKHKVFLSVGHDEYWSGGQRTNVEAARNAGLHLAFFSGNESFWKTRWEPSIDGTNTAYRTLVCYKETHANARIDPTGIWTGTWRDPRFSPPADGGRPENAMSGTIFTVNSGTSGMAVPSAEGKHRFWRNTTVATLAPGATATMPTGTLGYEWDEDLDNGARPSGLMRLSLRTVAGVDKLQDFGSTYAAGTATHTMTLYRHANGALVFGAGTIQYSWGLDSNHDRGSTAPDVRMRQATVNLFADMGVQPGTPQSDLSFATASTDTIAPSTVVTSPSPGASLTSGSSVTIAGTASDAGGGILTSVEVSVDGGATWKPATGLANWTFSWIPTTSGPRTIMSRAWDDTGNVQTPGSAVSVTVTGASCDCYTIWSDSTVPSGSDADTNAVEVGTKFRATTNGYVMGVRFYKFTGNTGTHVGNLWTTTGTRLATVTFTNESATGWQQATFSSPVAINANTTYVISYHAPGGRYAVNTNYWATAVNNPPLRGLQNGEDGPNGVYAYGTTSSFPTNSFNSENYWVDVAFATSLGPDTTAPTVSTTFPVNLAAGVSADSNISASFSEGMDGSTINANTFELRDASNTLVPASITYDAATRTAILDPATNLRLAANYTAIVRGGAADPRVKDPAGNALSENVVWTFTTSSTPPDPLGCPCTIWPNTALPDRQDIDTTPVEVGVRFRSTAAGFVSGLRFYKHATNTGTHIGNLWSSTGTKLATATFTNETATGWQTVMLPSPVPIAANTTYIASYHADGGRYAVSSGYFATAGVTRGPLSAPRDGQFGGNGVYAYGTVPAFPTNTFNSENYWIDVVFTSSPTPDTTPPEVTLTSPTAGRAGVNLSAPVSATFSEGLNSATVGTSTGELRTITGTLVPASVSYDGATLTVTITPASPLAYSTSYRVTLKGGAADSRIKDLAGNALASDYSWTFTTAAPPPPPPDQGPGGPVLVVASPSNPFSRYFAEILRNEGFNEFDVVDLAQVSAASLGAYDVVILGDMALTDSQVSMFAGWVNAGGNLIAMRPDKKLAGLLGLTDAGTILANAYLLMNTATAPASGLVGETIQFHGTADRYTVSGATVIATLYSNATTATANPAVTMRSVGSNGGQAAAFTFDLARSIVYTRQGNPAWSGQERDAQAPIRSDDLFFGARSGDVQPDWVDLAKVAIPQADEQQRLLGQLILDMNRDRKPLPRFWYLPRMLRAAIVMTGDDHASGGTAGRFERQRALSPANCSVGDWQCVRSTSYIYPFSPLSNSAAAGYEADGFEVAVHISTNCGNYTAANLDSFYVSQLQSFETAFPSVSSPLTNRMHCIVWSDYDSQPLVEVSHGIRLNTSYYYWPSAWVTNRPGMFTGSGWPMRFARITGEMIDSYQATSQMTDESGQTYPFTVDTLLDRALGPLGYYGVFTANMHTDQVTVPGSDEIVLSALARGVPVVSARQMLEWLDGRNGSSFENIAWAGSTLSFQVLVGAGAGGLHVMVPAASPSGALTGVQRDGVHVPYTLQTVKGVEYATFPGDTGSYQVAYGVDSTPPLISAVSASASTGTATVSWLTNELSDSRVDYGTTPGALTQNVTAASLVTNHSVVLPGLAPNTTYYYRVRSADGLGNAATSPEPADSPLSFETGPPAVSIANASVVEGNAGASSLAFPLTLAPASTQTVTINYSLAGISASPDADFVSQPGILTFDPGQTSKILVVDVNGDGLDEADETLLITLSNPVNATIAQPQATGTILDDDPSPSISVNDIAGVEGNAGTVSTAFTLSLSATSGRSVTVNYATANGSAVAPADYATTSGTATFAPGSTSQVVNVAVIGDTMDEPDETFVLNLTSPTNATIAPAQGVATITDDDAPPSVSISNASRAEGNSGSAIMTFAVTLSAPSGWPASVAYATSDGSGVAGADYSATSGTLNFVVGTTTMSINVPIIGDTVSEPNETFIVSLANPVNVSLGSAQATGTIQNDDGVPALNIADVTVTEGNAGTVNAVFQLTLTPATTQAVTVDYSTANATATAGSDYVAASGTVTFAPGAATASITVVVTGDTTIEPTETFTVNLTNPVNATLSRTQATGTITSDDGVSGLVAAYNFDEASGTTVMDRSANGLNGTITGATRTTAGHAGSALTFNGSGNWVTVNDNALLDVTRITVSAWVRPTTLSGWRTVVLKETTSSLAYGLYAHDNAPRPAAYINTGGSDIAATGTAGLALNTWTFLAATFDGSAIRFYADGVLVRTVNTTGNIINGSGPLRIGGNAPWGEYFAGQIDDVRIYSRALTQSEIQTDMKTPVQ